MTFQQLQQLLPDETLLPLGHNRAIIEKSNWSLNKPAILVSSCRVPLTTSTALTVTPSTPTALQVTLTVVTTGEFGGDRTGDHAYATVLVEDEASAIEDLRQALKTLTRFFC